MKPAPPLWARLRAALWSGLALALLLAPVPVLALTASGLVLGPDGQPLAGALVSDGRQVTTSAPDGRFQLDTEPGRVVSLCAPPGYAPPARWWWPAAEAAGLELKLAAAPTQPRHQVALLSDPHLMDAQAPTLHYPPPPGGWDLPLKTWRRVAEDLAAQKPDLTLVTGDLCMDGDQGGPDHTQAQMALAAQAMALLPAPARALPGNHDVRYQDDATPPTVDLAIWRQHLGPARQALYLGGAAWLLWDNLGRGRDRQGKPRSLGQTPEEALAWLEAALAEIPRDMPLVLAAHYPPVSPLVGGNPLGRHQLVKADSKSGLGLRDVDQALPRLVTLLKDRKLLAWIHGHEHASHESILHLRQGPWHILGLPAVCGRWWIGDRDFGDIAFPPGYVMLTLTPTPQGPRLDSRLVEVKF